jgi:hypothetical protein
VYMRQAEGRNERYAEIAAELERIPVTWKHSLRA